MRVQPKLILPDTCRSLVSVLPLLLSHPLPLSLSPLLSHSLQKKMETQEDDERLDQVDSVPDSEAASTNSATSFLSSILNSSGAEDSLSTTSSGCISSTTSGSSGEIPAAVVVVVPTDVEEGREALVVPVMVTERLQKCVGRNNQFVSWGLKSVIGRRREMEDAAAVIPGFMRRTCDQVGGCTAPGSRTSSEISPVHFFAVYDGHGGSQVANFCKERMHEVIAEEWDREAVDGYEWQRRWETTFASGFQRADNEVVSEAVAPEMVGSTAVVVVLSGCQIITSNCGDSRAVLCQRTQTIPLSVDQKPDRQDELMRIEQGGGRVINWNGARVLGVLAMSRAIGDRYLRPWIIPVPEITFRTRTEEDECLILATDGLWDVMTNEEVGEVARRVLRRWRRAMLPDDISLAQAIADNLTDIAFSRSSSDNISIIVVDLKKRRRQVRQFENGE